MSLNHIHLTPQLLANLYTDTLIESYATVMPDQTYHYQSLGGNKKNILIVVAKQNQPFLPDNELQFLTSILSACKLSLADIALVNLDRLKEKGHQQLIDHFKSKFILLFNVEPLQFGLPIHFPPFQIQEFSKCIYMFAPDLQQIEMDKQLKKNLWIALKDLFCL